MPILTCAGHSDVVMGMIVTRSDALADKLRFLQFGVPSLI